MDLPQKRPFKRPRDVFTYTSSPPRCISILTPRLQKNDTLASLLGFDDDKPAHFG
jgi:hypothetical protein